MVGEVNSFPPTVIVVHRKERAEKCSVEPLRGRPDMRFVRFPVAAPMDLTGYVRLALEGPMLGAEDVSSGLLVLDATWRLAGKMEREFLSVPPRRLPLAKTAYPRNSKLTQDPEVGLATVEAIYLAYWLLGRSTMGLLDQYRWGEEFLVLNGELFA